MHIFLIKFHGGRAKQSIEQKSKIFPQFLLTVSLTLEVERQNIA